MKNGRSTQTAGWSLNCSQQVKSVPPALKQVAFCDKDLFSWPPSFHPQLWQAFTCFGLEQKTHCVFDWKQCLPFCCRVVKKKKKKENTHKLTLSPFVCIGFLSWNWPQCQADWTDLKKWSPECSSAPAKLDFDFHLKLFSTPVGISETINTISFYSTEKGISLSQTNGR